MAKNLLPLTLSIAAPFILVTITTALLSLPTSSTSSRLSVFVPSSCSLEGVVGSPHTATINPGMYKDGIGTTTFKVFCNDNNGYNIYAVGYANNELGNNKLIATIGGTLSPTHDIITGTGTDTTSSSGVSNWAMKVSAVNGTYTPTIQNNYNNYSLVPATYTKIATFPSATDHTTGSSITTTYAAYILGTQPAGKYEGIVKYTLVHPATNIPNEPKDCDANTICYHPNAGNEVVDTMGDQTTNYSNSTDPIASNMDVTLWASNFKRDGYGFVGWSDKYDWTLNQNDTNGNGTGSNIGYHIYGPNQTITTGDLSQEGLSLYAVWVKSAGILQNWQGCNAMSINEVTALTDQRDNSTYAVAKLKDNKCWMVENLRLDNQYTTGAYNESLAQGYAKNSTYGDFIGLAAAENSKTDWLTSNPNSLYSVDGSTAINIGSTDGARFRFPRYNNENITTPISNMTNADQAIYSYGNLYTWSAAAADTGYYINASISVPTSICPVGWKLPTGARTGDWMALADAIIGYMPAGNAYFDAVSSNHIRSYPSNLVFNGYFRDDTDITYRGQRAAYWTATVVADQVDSFLRNDTTVEAASFAPGTGGGNSAYGRTIRCVLGN